LHDLFSLVRVSTHSVEIGDKGFRDNTFFEVVFSDFSKGCFGGFKVTFGVEELAL
jgi:hypothetical protein